MPHDRRNSDKPAQGVAASGPAAELLGAYEHLLRVDVLEGALAGPAFCDVSTLAALALAELGAGRAREAAGLLRAAEHISFAEQTPRGYASAMRVSGELRHAIEAEFDTVLRRAEHSRRQPSSQRHGAVPQICTRTLQMARDSFSEELFGRALELARAAELLAEMAVCSAIAETESLAS